LAGNDVDFLIPARQSQRIGLSPRYAAIDEALFASGRDQDWLIEIGSL